MQRLWPRFRSQQFFLSEICGEIFSPSLYRVVWSRHAGAHPDGHQHGVSIQISINLGKTFPHISHKKICCDLNLGQSLCIFTFLLFTHSGLYLLNSFDFYFDMTWHWKPAILFRLSKFKLCFTPWQLSPPLHQKMLRLTRREEKVSIELYVICKEFKPDSVRLQTARETNTWASAVAKICYGTSGGVVFFCSLLYS